MDQEPVTRWKIPQLNILLVPKMEAVKENAQENVPLVINYLSGNA